MGGVIPRHMMPEEAWFLIDNLLTEIELGQYRDALKHRLTMNVHYIALRQACLSPADVANDGCPSMFGAAAMASLDNQTGDDA